MQLKYLTLLPPCITWYIWHNLFCHMQECDSKLQLHSHFGAWIFRLSDRAFGNAVCSLGLPLCSKPRNGRLAKMGSFQRKKRSDWLPHRLLASIIVSNYDCQGTVWSPSRHSLQRKQGFFVFFFFYLDFCKALTNLIVYYPSVKA